MIRKKIDQSFTMVDISVHEFDDRVIGSIMNEHRHLAAARIQSNRFSAATSSRLIFYIHHRFFDSVDAVINDIKHNFKNHDILIKVSK